MHTAEAIAVEMAGRVGEIAKAMPGLSVKERVTQAARRLGLTPRRCAAYIYRELALIPAHEADLIREVHAAAKAERLARLRKEYEVLRNELAAEAGPVLGIMVPPALPPLKAA